MVAHDNMSASSDTVGGMKSLHFFCEVGSLLMTVGTSMSLDLATAFLLQEHQV